MGEELHITFCTIFFKLTNESFVFIQLDVLLMYHIFDNKW